MLSVLGRKFIQLLKFWFGDFTKDELKKFLLLGLVFTFIIGVYWTLRPLKDSILTTMAGKQAIPWAKLFSLCFVFPAVILYSKIIDKMSRHKLFYVICGGYAVATLVFAILLGNETFGIAPGAVLAQRSSAEVTLGKVLAYAFYMFVESFGSIVVAMFWGFVTDITLPAVARYGFPVVTLIGQIGGIVMPKYLSKLPTFMKAYENVPYLFKTSALVVLIAALLMLPIIFLIAVFMATTPKSQMVGFHSDASGKSADKVEEEPGFLEGLKLMVSTPYLFGIFGIITFFEVISTFFDFNFKGLVATNIIDEAEKTAYLGEYGSTVNLVTFICLLFGINNIQRFLGITFSLVLIPVWFGAALIAFMYFPGHLEFLFGLMIASKAINYALNGPSMKQLYVPTTREVRYKSQAWIESFGSRGAKALSSGINMIQAPLERAYGSILGLAYHMRLTQVIGLAMVVVWFMTSLYLGRTQKKAVETNKVVC